MPGQNVYFCYAWRMTKARLKEIQKKAGPILRVHDVEFAGIFGSFARGQEQDTSDIDIMIRYARPKSLFDLVGLSQALSATLGRRVDVVTEKAVHPYLKTNIAKDVQIIYGQRRYL